MAVQTPTRRSLLEYSLLAIPLYFFIIGPLLSSWVPDGSLGSNTVPGKSNVASFTDTVRSGRDYTKNYAAEHAEDDQDDHHAVQLDNLVLPRLDEDMAAICERPGDLMVRVLSREPLVLYIENFMTASEINSIISTGSPLLQISTTTSDGGQTSTVDTTIRNSTRALLPQTDTVQCIEHRAMQVQGFRKDVYVERLWLQKYEEGGHYSYHFDYSGDIRSHGKGRISSFMVFLNGEGDVDAVSGGDGSEPLQGGGTHFPYIAMPENRSWCRVLDCDVDKNREGVTFLPRKGNAVYWENFHPLEGRGFEETLHAGLPVTKGVKYGLNIWSWYQPGYRRAA